MEEQLTAKRATEKIIPKIKLANIPQKEKVRSGFTVEQLKAMTKKPKEGKKKTGVSINAVKDLLKSGTTISQMKEAVSGKKKKHTHQEI